MDTQKKMIIGEADDNKQIQLDIKADMIIARENINSLKRIAVSNSGDKQTELKELEKAVKKELIKKEPDKEKALKEIKSFENILLEQFITSQKEKKDEYVRYEYYKVCHILILIDDEYYKDFPNQISLKREVREKLWNILRFDIVKFCKNEHELVKTITTLFLKLICAYTVYKPDDIPSDWSKDFKGAFNKGLDSIRDTVDGKIVLSYEDIRKKVELYTKNNPRNWTPDKVKEQFMVMGGAGKLGEDDKYKDALAILNALKKDQEHLIEHASKARESKLLYNLKEIEHAQLKINAAKEDFYDRHKYTEQRDKFTNKFNKFNNANSFKRIYILDQATQNTQKYLAKTIIRSIVSGKLEFEIEDILSQVTSFLGPFAAMVPFGSFALELINSGLDEVFKKKEVSLIAKIQEEFKQLKIFFTAENDKQFFNIKSELRTIGITYDTHQTAATIRNKIRDVLDNIDNYSNVTHKQIDSLSRFFNEDFYSKLNGLLYKTYGLELNLRKKNLGLDKISGESLVGILKTRLYKNDNNFGLSDFYKRVNPFNNMLLNVIELMYYNRDAFLKFIAVAYSAEKKHKRNKEYYKIIRIIIQKQEKELKESKFAIDQIENFLRYNIWKIALGQTNGSIILSLYQHNYSFLIKPSFNLSTDSEKHNLLSFEKGKLVQKTAIDKNKTIDDHRFKVSLSSDVICLMGKHSKGNLAIGVNKMNNGSHVALTSKIAKQSNIVLFPKSFEDDKDQGIFTLKIKENNYVLDVLAYKKGNNAPVGLWEGKKATNQYFNLEIDDPRISQEMEDYESLVDYTFGFSETKPTKQLPLYGYFEPGTEIAPDQKYYSLDKKYFLILNSKTKKFSIRNSKHENEIYELPVDCDQVVFDQQGSLVAYKEKIEKKVTESNKKKVSKVEVWSSKTYSKKSCLKIESAELTINDYQRNRILWKSKNDLAVECRSIVPQFNTTHYIKTTLLLRYNKKRFYGEYFLDIDYNKSSKLPYSNKHKMSVYLNRKKTGRSTQNFEFIPTSIQNVYRIVSCCLMGQAPMPELVIEYTPKEENRPLSLKKIDQNKEEQCFLILFNGDKGETTIMPIKMAPTSTLVYSPYHTHRNKEDVHGSYVNAKILVQPFHHYENGKSLILNDLCPSYPLCEFKIISNRKIFIRKS